METKNELLQPSIARYRIECGLGFRFLLIGEHIEKGDQIWSFVNSQWIDVCGALIGCKVLECGATYRRKLKVGEQLGEACGYMFAMNVRQQSCVVICESPAHADTVFARLNGVDELDHSRCRWVRAEVFLAAESEAKNG